MGRLIGAAILITVTIGASGWARAQSAPPPAPYAPPAGPPIGQPYGYGAAPGAPSSEQLRLMYEADQKSPAVALIVEVFVPGVGSIYGGHPQGAVVTWGLVIGGVALVVWGIAHLGNSDPEVPSARTTDSPAAVPAILGGLGLAIAGRVYGLIDAYSSSNDYNVALASRLGLVSFSLAPIRGATNNLSWGPSLSLRF